MWISAITLAGLTIPSPTLLSQNDAKVKSDDNAGYVKVEIKGTLDTKGTPEGKWDSISKGSSTGVRILDSSLHRPWPWPELKNGPGPSVHAWELFLGEDKDLNKRAKSLKGKSVVARGTVTILEQSPGWRFPPTIRLIVRVSSLEEAEPRK